MIADIGLIFFLLLMGLELDISLLRSNAKKSIMISLTGIITTLALSCGISSLFYMEFVVPFSFTLQHPVSKLNYMMFIGVAMSVTAFPVLARILTERKLLSTTLGITVISGKFLFFIKLYVLCFMFYFFPNSYYYKYTLSRWKKEKEKENDVILMYYFIKKSILSISCCCR